MTCDEFRERLRTLRRWKRLTQAEVARRAGMATSQISHYEAGCRLPSLPNLLRLVPILGSPAYLFGEAEVPDPVHR